MQKSFKIDQEVMNNVEKRQTAVLSLEDNRYDILNMLIHYSEVFQVRASISTNNVCELHCTNATCTLKLA